MRPKAPRMKNLTACLFIIFFLTACNSKRDKVTNDVTVRVSVQLDAAYGMQQQSIVRYLESVKNDMEWTYNKGTVVTKTAAVIAIVAGLVVLSAHNGGSSGVVVSSSEHNNYIAGDTHLLFTSPQGEVIYIEQSIKPGMTQLEFFAPAETTIALFSGLNDTRYLLGSVKTGAANTTMDMTLNLVAASISLR